MKYTYNYRSIGNLGSNEETCNNLGDYSKLWSSTSLVCFLKLETISGFLCFIAAVSWSCQEMLWHQTPGFVWSRGAWSWVNVALRWTELFPNADGRNGSQSSINESKRRGFEAATYRNLCSQPVSKFPRKQPPNKGKVSLWIISAWSPGGVLWPDS